MSDGGNLPIGPGIWGFLAFFVLAVALFFLVRNMNSRLRRMAYRDRDRAEQAAEQGPLAGAAADADVKHPGADAAPDAEPDADEPGRHGDGHPGDDEKGAGGRVS